MPSTRFCQFFGKHHPHKILIAFLPTIPIIQKNMDDETIQRFNRTFYKKHEPIILYGKTITSNEKPAFPHYKEFAEKHRLDLQLFVTAMLKPYENNNRNIYKFFDSIKKHCKIQMVCKFVWTRGNRCNPAKGDKMKQGRENNIAKIMQNICDVYEWFDCQPIDVQNGYDKCDLSAIRQTTDVCGFDENVYKVMLQKYGYTKCWTLCRNLRNFCGIIPKYWLKNQNGYGILLKLQKENNLYYILDGIRINTVWINGNDTNWKKIIGIHEQLGIDFPRIKICRCLLKMSVEMETATIIENMAMLIIADIYMLKTVMRFL